MKTVEGIVTLIRIVPREHAIEMIENYALSREIQAVQKFQRETYGGSPEEIEAAINRIEAQLDELLEKTMEAYTAKL